MLQRKFAATHQDSSLRHNTKDPLNKTTMPQTESFYAVRGGMSPGIYNNWPDAVNAGWYQRQPFGNAVKCESREQAEQFLSIRGASISQERAQLHTPLARATSQDPARATIHSVSAERRHQGAVVGCAPALPRPRNHLRGLFLACRVVASGGTTMVRRLPRMRPRHPTQARTDVHESRQSPTHRGEQREPTHQLRLLRDDAFDRRPLCLARGSPRLITRSHTTRIGYPRISYRDLPS